MSIQEQVQSGNNVGDGFDSDKPSQGKGLWWWRQFPDIESAVKGAKNYSWVLAALAGSTLINFFTSTSSGIFRYAELVFAILYLVSFLGTRQLNLIASVLGLGLYLFNRFVLVYVMLNSPERVNLPPVRVSSLFVFTLIILLLVINAIRAVASYRKYSRVVE